nr:PREDICTED: LOW QUALITY PROTEIN: geminin [Anolis carolinensis]|eukprot:XP_016848460.1 PREDICTED: LOW QUALITY PROTEIN: geminin [Anolis carolinensis]
MGSPRHRQPQKAVNLLSAKKITYNPCYMIQFKSTQMNSRVKQKLDAEEPITTKQASRSNTNSTSQRQTLKMIQPSITGCLVGRSNEGKSSIKRKIWSDQMTSKASKPETAVEKEHINTSVLQASDLTTKVWKVILHLNIEREVAEERRKALYEVLQENEKLHKEIELKDGEISRLKEENEELAELANHVQYMSDMIERLTGQAPEDLETPKNLDLEGTAYEENDSTEEDVEDDTKGQCSQLSSSITESILDLPTTGINL